MFWNCCTYFGSEINSASTLSNPRVCAAVAAISMGRISWGASEYKLRTLPEMK